MAPVAFHLLAIKRTPTRASFLTALQGLPEGDHLLWVGECHHWMSPPHVSARALTGSGPTIQRWDYLVVNRTSSLGNLTVPTGIQDHIEKQWSIDSDVADVFLDSLSSRLVSMRTNKGPSLGPGWSAEDHSGLDNARSPADLELSLAKTTRPFDSDKSTDAVTLQELIRDFGISYTGPVAMFNLLSYLPNKRPQYRKYVAAFVELIGPKLGPEPIFGGEGVTEWTSKGEEGVTAETEVWEDAALVWYPNIWSFAKMLDDPVYADLDRKYKQEVLRDNPLVCCTEVRLDE